MKTTGQHALTADQVAAYADTASKVLDLTIPEAYRAGVIANLERLFQLGDLAMSFPLPDDIEVAPVFRP
jgi:hypothetical protein